MCLYLFNWLGYDIDMGTIMIAWFGISFSVVSMLAEIVLLCNIESLMFQSAFADYCTPAKICLIVDLALNLVSGVACVLAIVGTLQKNRLLLVPWMVRSFLNSIESMAIAIFFLVIAIKCGFVVVGVSFLLATVVSVVALMSCWTVVNGLYEQLGVPASFMQPYFRSTYDEVP